MNSLSWMIYWAGVVQNLQVAFALFAGGAALASIFVVMAYEGDPPQNQWLRLTIPAFVLFGVLSAFTPDRNTMYAIAASEMGAEVLKAPEASKARQALNAWLDKQIDAKREAK